MINALPVLTSTPVLNRAEKKLFSVTKVVYSNKKGGRGGSNSCLIQNHALGCPADVGLQQVILTPSPVSVMVKTPVVLSSANQKVCSLVPASTNSPLLFLCVVPSSKLMATNLLRQVKARGRRQAVVLGCVAVPQQSHRWGRSTRHHWQDTRHTPGSRWRKEHSDAMLVKTS